LRIAEEWVLLSRERRDLRRNFAKHHCGRSGENKESHRRMRAFPLCNCVAIILQEHEKQTQLSAIPKRLPVCYFLEQADSLARVVTAGSHTLVSFLLQIYERKTSSLEYCRYLRGRATTL
jgi:hypothetical protein